MPSRVVQAGPLGGAHNELGGELRARFAAYASCFGLRGMPLRLGRSISGVPVAIRCEVDEHVDDVEITFQDGSRVLVQVKLQLGLDFSVGKPFHGVILQWIDQCRASDQGDVTPLIAVCAKASKDVTELASALESGRDPHSGAHTASEAAALESFKAAVERIGPGSIDQILRRCSILRRGCSGQVWGKYPIIPTRRRGEIAEPRTGGRLHLDVMPTDRTRDVVVVAGRGRQHRRPKAWTRSIARARKRSCVKEFAVGLSNL